MKRVAGLLLLLMVSMILVACAGPGDLAPVEPIAQATEAPAVENVTPAPEEAQESELTADSQSIVDIAVADGRFNTLVAAVQAAGLVETLSGDGEFTVFAPTDDAFAALPSDTLNSLMDDPEGALQDILLYHVVQGSVPAEAVVTLPSATTIQGEPVSITVTDGNVVLNGNANVVLTDVMASNGIIHVIDAVLLPPSMSEAEAQAAMPEEETALASIAEIAAEDGRFNTLVAAVEAAGLAETLSSDGQFTLFAPTDEAFAALPAGTVESLLQDPEGALRDILLYHVVEGVVPAETVVMLEAATTIQGEPVTIAVADGSVILNDSAKVIITDVQASNGIIHVIDAVLLPPSMSEAEANSAPEADQMAATKSIAEIAAEDGRFTTLVAALQAAGLDEVLSSDETFTVFAPTDDAFAALPAGTVEALLQDPQGALTDVLLYHVLDSVVPADKVVNYEEAVTMQGQTIAVAVVDDQVVLNDSATVIIPDIAAKNGIIHVIDAVLLPPAAESASATADDMAAEGKSIATIATEDGRFTTLVAALQAAGLAETLDGAGSFTVFAPTDDAFAALPEGTVESLLEDPEGALKDILLYHVVDGAVPAETVVTLDSAKTLLGKEVRISQMDGNVLLNDTVKVVITDIMASNGIIHVIDAVLLPPADEISSVGFGQVHGSQAMVCNQNKGYTS